jgi:ubiquinone/menaquinone biosynthesis C-methylase UbiE
MNIQQYKPHLKRVMPFALYYVARKLYHNVYLPRRYDSFARADDVQLEAFGIHAAPPPPLRHRTHGSPDVASFLRNGRRQLDVLRSGAARLGASLDDVQRVLDFGCGCGRTALWFRKHYPHVDYHGVDIDAESVRWAQEHMKFGSFQVNSANPPLPFADHQFDLVFAISVFTHLPEDLAGEWLRELRRVTQPGGLVFLSVHASHATHALSRSQRSELRERGICHARAGAMGRLFPDYYQNTYHTEEYIREHWGEHFDVVQVESLGVQDLVLMRSPTLDRVGAP